MQALDQLDLQPSEWLLVTGAAGALGGFALELAAMRGLRTVAVASSQDEALVRRLGANEFVARTGNLGVAVRRVLPRGVDGAVDAALVGMPALDAVRDGGAFAALSAGTAPIPLRGTRVHNVWIRTDARGLAELAALADAGRLTPRIAATEPLETVAAAHHRLAAGGLRGRIVLEPTRSASAPVTDGAGQAGPGTRRGRIADPTDLDSELCASAPAQRGLHDRNVQAKRDHDASLHRIKRSAGQRARPHSNPARQGGC